MDLEVDDAAIDLIAEEAFKRGRASQIGARILADLVEEVLRDAKFAATNFGPLDIRVTGEHVTKILEEYKRGEFG